MQALSNSDLNLILRRIPRDVRALMKANELILGGGFIRSTIAGERVNDIDLFGLSPTRLELVAIQFAVERGGRVHKTDNAITVLTPGGRLPIQFITKWTYGILEVERLLNEFDFTIAKAAVWWDPIDKSGQWRSLVDDRFFQDLAAKRLVYTFPQRPEAAGGSLLRARKFLSKGYNIQAESLAGVIARLVGAVKEEGLGALIEGGLTKEQAMTKVLTGLLREVDPLIVVDRVGIEDEHSDLASETSANDQPAT